MKRRLRENIEIGDEVYVPRDEYTGTVIDINGDEVLIDGPFGEEYFDINDLKKLGGYYEEDETPKFFEKNVTESKRKKIIRLTERDLTRIVKRVINEEPMDDFTSQSVYRKLVHNGDIMDQEYKEIKNIRDQLDNSIRQHLSRGSISDIFDLNKRTPSDISDLVNQLTSKMSRLESTVNQYKRMVRNAITD
jgi:hypothetical protein